ncbi:VOC family protein [Mucilaginibacter antarcticus]|uniref:VOC family protein n=1 Tax=Mucilaginibacter antarcticus TaxID=1855725 RepID=A0ABW5XT03_9SPHI
MATVQKIQPCLWFDTQAQEAAEYYTSIFKNSSIIRITYYPNVGQDVHGKPAGSVLTVEFELEGQNFMALNGGPMFNFTAAISLSVNCDTQEEIDYYWDKLTTGGDPAAQQCGWLKDKYGLSWQVAPVIMTELLNDPDPQKRARVMEAYMPMQKFDLATILKAYNSE